MEDLPFDDPWWGGTIFFIAIKLIENKKDQLVYQLGSGDYEFTIQQ